MEQKHYWMVLVAALGMYLVSLGGILTAVDSWKEVTQPAMVGALILQLGSVTGTVMGALGINLKKGSQ